MHPSRRMSFNLAFFFVGKHPRQKHSGCLKRIWVRSWFCLLCCTSLLCPIIHLLPWGVCLTELRQCAVCLNSESQGKPRASLHISFSGSFTNGLSHWQSWRFCCWIFAMLFNWNRNSACVLESCLLFVVSERMWQDAVVGRSCVMSH